MAANKKIILMAVLALGTLGVGGYAVHNYGTEHTDDASLDTNIVTIAPRVGGYVAKMLVKDNQLVKAGDAIIEIDPVDYQIALDKAEAAYTAAQARQMASTSTADSTRVSAPKTLEAAEAQVNSAQAVYDNAAGSLNRLRKLSDVARSKQQLDDAIAEQGKALASLNDAKARLASAQTAPKTIAAADSTTDSLSAEMKQAAADVAQAKKNLNDTKILAPIDGKITSRGVEMGDYVQPGQNLMSVVSQNFWVTANFKETQLAKMRIGQKVDVEVDAFPDLKLTGHVDSIQSGTGARFSAFPPQNATGNFVKIVQRVPVKIVLDGAGNPDVALGAGMSVTPIVHTKQ